MIDFKSKTLLKKKAEDKQKKKRLKRDNKSNQGESDSNKPKTIERLDQGYQTELTDLIVRKVLISTESQTDDATKTEDKAEENESKNPKSKDYECFYCGTTIRNKIFIEYHRTNCHVKFDNIMHSFGKIKEDSKFSCKVCNKFV